MTVIVNAASQIVHLGTSAGGTDYRYGEAAHSTLNFGVHQGAPLFKLVQLLDVSTRKKRKQWENHLAKDGMKRAEARAASYDGFIARVISQEDADKIYTPELRKKIEEHMAKEGYKPVC